MSFTFLETTTAPIQIKPYFSQKIDNMGLEKYGLSLFDGVFHEEQLACVENNGVRRYITGLNEFAPSVKQIKDPEKREAKINEIRKIVAQLEMELASNSIRHDDPEFWNKVKLLRPDNDAFWGKISIRCGNHPVYLNPQDPHDLIKILAIEEGGFSIIAKSYEDAKTKPGGCKFYLDRYEETISTKTSTKKIKNKALAKLQKLYDFIPLTFTLPKDYIQFSEAFYYENSISGPLNFWILKPIGKSRGRGISMINELS